MCLRLLALFLILTSSIILPSSKGQQVEAYIFSESTNQTKTEDDALLCPDLIHNKLTKLGDECKILKLYNRTEVESMDELDLEDLSEHCACQLLLMNQLWEKSFSQNYKIYRLAKIVTDQEVTKKHLLWTDIDVVARGISIYTATKDYFDRGAQLPAIPGENFQIVLLISEVCYRIVMDPYKLYRYSENLIRVNPRAFLKLLNVESINIVYQASKACKLLLTLGGFDQYKLKPTNGDLVPVDETVTLGGEIFENEESNEVKESNIDLNLKFSSALLLNCSKWQETRSSLMDLKRDCPMMIMRQDEVPIDWIKNHNSELDRTTIAIKCGCQLLLHNSTWNEMMRDPNIQIMSTAIINHMNRNKVPDFSNTPLWAIHDWFKGIMSKFSSNRKFSIKEIIKTRRGSEDPLEMINKQTGDETFALELLRKGCNYIMLNYHKGTNLSDEIKLIKYLDNLRLMTPDPLFVFGLTLQDINLFKIYTLSKMCKPIIS